MAQMPATDGAMDVDLEADATVRNTFEAGCTAGVDGLSEEAKPFLEFLEIDVLEEQLETGAGATRKVSKGYWATFCDRLQRGQVEPRCVIDFAYSDGGGLNLAEHEQLLERAYCFVDKRDKDGEWRQVVAHVHTLKPWTQAVKEQPCTASKTHYVCQRQACRQVGGEWSIQAGVWRGELWSGACLQ